MLEILKNDGTVNLELEPEIPENLLLKMLDIMILVRVMDEKAMRLQRQGRIGFHIPYVGQEATQTGAAAALQPDDWVFPSYREPAVALYRGLPLEDVVNHWFGNELDPQLGRRLPGLFGSKDHFFVNSSAPIGTQIIQATGAGYASKYLDDKKVILAFFGDGATSSNDFHSGLNFAGVFQTPTVFFCQNNQYAISVPLSKQTASESIAIKARAYGMPGIQVDGNDVLAVYKAVKEATERARNGSGPVLIEAVTYRLGPHTSSDDPTKYRTGEEVEKWRELDPIARYEKYLKSRNLVTEEKLSDIRNNYSSELDKLIIKAEKSAQPPLKTLFTGVLAELPWHLQEQLQELIELKNRGLMEENV